MSLSLCIIARNNAHSLTRALNAIDAAAAGRRYTACLLAPNLTGAAYGLARAYAAADNRVSFHEIPLSDTAHALNVYIHRLAPAANCHVFIDSAVEPCPGAFAHLADALENHSAAYGAAALAATGRSRRRWAAKTILNDGLNRQLFALSRECVARLRAQEIYLPLGLEGVGGLIAYLLLTDLKAGGNASAFHRLIVADDAMFAFDPIGLRRRDLAVLRERLLQRARRRVQNETLYPLLKRDGLKAMPATVAELNRLTKIRRPCPRLDPVNWWFDRAALDEIAGS